LGTIGVAYAEWSQKLTINGTVNTAYISASFNSDVRVPTDPHGIATVAGSIAKSNPINKDAKGEDLNDVLNITITDAYPGYNGVVTFYVDNNGTMPLYVEAGKPVVTDINGYSYDANSNTCADVIAVTPLVDIGAIVYPTHYSAAFTLEISIPQPSNPVQNSTYHVVVPLVAHQYLP
jgi:hypothetical protein